MKALLMKCWVFAGLTVGLLSIMPSLAMASSLDRSGYALVWADEFDGDTVNPENWDYELGPTWYNGEQQAYTDRNAFVRDGKLVIQARQDPYPTEQSPVRYTSSRLLTQGKQSWKYGLIEARVKRPSGIGTFPAFWMMGNDYSREAAIWPYCGEIGIAEFLATEDPQSRRSGFTNLHYGLDFARHKSLHTGKSAFVYTDISDGYHEYALEWTPTTMAWYLDGELQPPGVVNYTELQDYEDEFNRQSFFIVFTLAVGFDMFDSQFVADPKQGRWPQELSVDWVRVSQK